MVGEFMLFTVPGIVKLLSVFGLDPPLQVPDPVLHGISRIYRICWFHYVFGRPLNRISNQLQHFQFVESCEIRWNSSDFISRQAEDLTGHKQKKKASNVIGQKIPEDS